MSNSESQTSIKRELSTEETTVGIPTPKKFKPVCFGQIAKASIEARIVPAEVEACDWQDLLAIALPRSKTVIKVRSVSTSLADRSYVQLETPDKEKADKMWRTSLKWADVEFVAANLVGKEAGEASSKVIEGRTVSVEAKTGGKTGQWVYYMVTLTSSDPEKKPHKLCLGKEVASCAAEVLTCLRQLMSVRRQCLDDLPWTLVREMIFACVYQSLYASNEGIEKSAEEVEKEFDANKETLMEIINKACVMLDIGFPTESEIPDLRLEGHEIALGKEVEAPAAVIESLVFLHDRIKYNKVI